MTMIAQGAGRREFGAPERAPAATRDYRLPAKALHWLTAVLVVLMVTSAVIAKQLNGGPVADFLFGLHKLTGVLTLAVIVLRIAYRVVRGVPATTPGAQPRTALHWGLYAVIVMVPLIGWAGISDFGSRETLYGITLPAIWPEGAGYADLLLQVHAYLAFGLLALVALHIGIAMQDYMTQSGEAPPDERR